MSVSEPNNDRLEATVVPVRLQQQPSDDRQEPPLGSRYRGALLFGLVVLLAAGLVLVFGYLPQDRASSEPDAQPVAAVETEPAEPVEAPLTAREYEQLRGQAEDMLAQLLEQRSELEDRSVSSWGAEDWDSYRTAAREADDALIADDVRAAVAHYETALTTGERLFTRSQEITTNAQAAGEAAIEAGNPELALTQFDLVLLVDPDRREALQGRERALALPDVLAAMRRGDTARSAGDLESAAAAYREALGIDRDWQPARAALDQVTGRLAESRFESLIADGYVALDAGRFDDAFERFSDAVAMRPNSADARDGLAQAEQGRTLNAITMAEVRGLAFERRELWDEAIARYREALALDASLAFAIEGLERAQTRADLESKLKALIESPRLLLSEDVLKDAGAVLAEARAIAEPGPMHTELTGQLAGLIDLATTPISVTLVSDNATEVTVYRVGDLGAFTSMELDLRPGQYTAIGARRGYRDVRETFTVLPGRENTPITVICVEPI